MQFSTIGNRQYEHACHVIRPLNEELILMGALLIFMAALISLVGGFMCFYMWLDRRR